MTIVTADIASDQSARPAAVPAAMTSYSSRGGYSTYMGTTAVRLRSDHRRILCGDRVKTDEVVTESLIELLSAADGLRAGSAATPTLSTAKLLETVRRHAQTTGVSRRALRGGSLPQPWPNQRRSEGIFFYAQIYELIWFQDARLRV